MTQPQFERIVTAVTQGPEHERLYRDLIRRAGVAISAAESWVLWHVAARGPISAGALAARLELDPTVLGELFRALRRRKYLQTDPQGLPDLTAKGRHAVVALIKAGQDEVARLIRDLEPAGWQGRTRAMRRLTRAGLTTMPARASDDTYTSRSQRKGTNDAHTDHSC